MSLPAHLALRLLVVTLLCLTGAIAWTLWEARTGLREEAAVSAGRIAAQFARQPGLGSVGPAALPMAEPQAEPTVLMILPGICAEIRLGAEAPRRLCGDWDGLGTAPAWLAGMLAAEAGAGPVIREILYRGRSLGRVSAWPDPVAAAGRAWRQVRFAGGLALTLAGTTAILGWLAAARLVAPAARIVHGLDGFEAGRTPSSLPHFKAAEFDRIATAFNALAERLSRIEVERAGLMQRLVQVQEEERQSLARDLHDAFGQCLAAAGALAAAIEAGAPKDRVDLRADAAGIEAVVGCMRESLRGALAQLELPDFAGIGLGEGLRRLVSDWQARLRAGPSLHLDVTGDWAGLSPQASASVYRIAQELLTNALRHGRPSRIFLRLQRSETGRRPITLTVEDDGGGDAAGIAEASGRGLAGIRARLAVLGGELSLTGNGSGLRACATVPTAG
ncbi:signal transduction histidine kinase [Methylorubrum populi]|uniref:Signal transduction histidine kinase n=1 Tax=Methylorubrum populi TaxID=223967 RepID=A0A160PG26_9HYPH|nr:histidine kinase [Methylorubrum populi]BAU92199.1 signal transduction histidine kinase [Methylorubrum populi]